MKVFLKSLVEIGLSTNGQNVQNGCVCLGVLSCEAINRKDQCRLVASALWISLQTISVQSQMPKKEGETRHAHVFLNTIVNPTNLYIVTENNRAIISFVFSEFLVMQTDFRLHRLALQLVVSVLLCSLRELGHMNQFSAHRGSPQLYLTTVKGSLRTATQVTWSSYR